MALIGNYELYDSKKLGTKTEAKEFDILIKDEGDFSVITLYSKREKGRIELEFTFPSNVIEDFAHWARDHNLTINDF